MSTNLFMCLLLALSAIISMMSNSWVSIWILLEVNTLSFCTLLQAHQKKETQKNSEMSMKYLIVQSIASAIFLLSVLYSKHTQTLLVISIVPLLALMVKIAAIPFHRWFIQISKNLSWGPAMLLFTWQKLAPLYLMLYQLKTGILFFILFSASGGAVSMADKKLLKEIMAWSSVFNLSWMLFSMMVSMKVFLTFTALYWMSVSTALFPLSASKKETTEEMNSSTDKWILLLVMMNLAGLPPLIGFLAKWMAFTEGLKTGMYSVVTLLLIASAINLYIYLRVATGSAMKNTWAKQKVSSAYLKSFSFLFLAANSLALVSIPL